LRNQASNQRMDRIERAAIFDSQSGQRIDVEKSPDS